MDRLTESDVRRLWRQCYPGLVRYVTTVLGGDRYAAEDVVQEAMMRLWRHRDRLSDVDTIDRWLRTVAKRLIIDRSRRRATRPIEVPGFDSDQTVPDVQETVLAELVAADLLRGLNPVQREAVYEVHVRGMSVEQAARRLGVPQGTVKSRCHYALRMLRETLPAAA